MSDPRNSTESRNQVQPQYYPHYPPPPSYGYFQQPFRSPRYPPQEYPPNAYFSSMKSEDRNAQKFERMPVPYCIPPPSMYSPTLDAEMWSVGHGQRMEDGYQRQFNQSGNQYLNGYPPYPYPYQNQYSPGGHAQKMQPWYFQQLEMDRRSLEMKQETGPNNTHTDMKSGYNKAEMVRYYSENFQEYLQLMKEMKNKIEQEQLKTHPVFEDNSKLKQDPKLEGDIRTKLLQKEDIQRNGEKQPTSEQTDKKQIKIMANVEIGGVCGDNFEDDVDMKSNNKTKMIQKLNLRSSIKRDVVSGRERLYNGESVVEKKEQVGEHKDGTDSDELINEKERKENRIRNAWVESIRRHKLKLQNALRQKERRKQRRRQRKLAQPINKIKKPYHFIKLSNQQKNQKLQREQRQKQRERREQQEQRQIKEQREEREDKQNQEREEKLKQEKLEKLNQGRHEKLNEQRQQRMKKKERESERYRRLTTSRMQKRQKMRQQKEAKERQKEIQKERKSESWKNLSKEREQKNKRMKEGEEKERRKEGEKKEMEKKEQQEKERRKEREKKERENARGSRSKQYRCCSLQLKESMSFLKGFHKWHMRDEDGLCELKQNFNFGKIRVGCNYQSDLPSKITQKTAIAIKEKLRANLKSREV